MQRLRWIYSTSSREAVVCERVLKHMWLQPLLQQQHFGFATWIALLPAAHWLRAEPISYFFYMAAPAAVPATATVAAETKCASSFVYRMYRMCRMGNLPP